MKLNLCLLGLVLFLISCSTTTPRYKQLTQNYEMVDKIVKNPDSLYFWLKDSNFVCEFYLDAYTQNSQYHDFKNETDIITTKIKKNHFENGYSYYYDDLRLSQYNTFLEHWIWIKSNKTGKKLFFELNNDEGMWKIYRIETYIQFGIDYDIEIVE